MYSESLPPTHCDDETFAEVEAAVPTITSFGRYLHSIAALMPVLQDAVVSANTPFTKYKEVLRVDKEMRRIALHGRPPFLAHGAVQDAWPHWTPWARRAAALSSSHKIIMIHRKFLTSSFTNAAFAFTRQTCVAASKTILHEVLQPLDEAPTLWIYHAFTVAASITLCLDLLYRPTSDASHQEHLSLVQNAIEWLEGARLSTIASRGVPILKNLLTLTRTPNGLSSNGKRRADTAMNTEPQPTKRRAVDMAEVVRKVDRSVSDSTSPGASRALQAEFRATDWQEQQNIQSSWHPTASAVSAEGDPFLSPGLGQGLLDFRDRLWTTDANVFGHLLNLAQT
jgi:hypothetical protein